MGLRQKVTGALSPYTIVIIVTPAQQKPEPIPSIIERLPPKLSSLLLRFAKYMMVATISNNTESTKTMLQNILLKKLLIMAPRFHCRGGRCSHICCVVNKTKVYQAVLPCS